MSAQTSPPTGAPAGAPPAVQNARFETRPVSGSLDAAFRAIETAQPTAAPDGEWIGYAAAQVPGERNMCCWNSNAGYPGCALESQIGTTVFGPNPTSTVHLEGAPEFFVLYRIENRRVEKIHSYSADCTIDAGGRPLIWLTGVKPEESTALLASLIPSTAQNNAGRQLASSAVNAIGLHRDGIPVLIDLARHSADAEVRKQAASWLGRSKDPRATRFYEEVFAK